MTGTERLRNLAGAWDEWGLGGTLADVADQIEREHDAEVADSPYDAILPEDREAAAWVREHGGLGAVKKMAAITLDVYQRLVDGNAGLEMLETDAGTIDSMMAEIVEAIINRGKERMRALELLDESVPRVTYERRIIKRQRQIDESHAALRRRNERIAELEHERGELYEMMRILNAQTDEIEARLMPEGCEWPRYESGELVGFGDEMSRIGEIFAICLYCDGSFSLNFRSYQKGEFVKRTTPNVRDADGVEICVGDKPYRVDNGKQVEVRRVDQNYGEECVFVGVDGTALGYWLRPGQLTHERPDSWDRLWDDIENCAVGYEGFMRRVKALVGDA